MDKGKMVSFDNCSYEDDKKEDSSSNYGPRKKILLVLGIGGLLCRRVCRRDMDSIPTFRFPDASYGSILVYKRPHCEELMKFCLERFEVGIWSSAKEWYMSNALDCIMKGLQSKLLFAWDQNECTNTGFFTLENANKPLFLKDLKKLWLNRSVCRGKFTSSNTLLIDDNPYKALLNPPNTAIFPDEYTVDDKNDDDLGPKGKLRVYLENLAAEDDVQSYVKKNPFGQPTITPTHSQWNYYSEVVRRFSVERVMI